MANKRKCPHCGNYEKPDKMLKVQISYFCNIECATSHAYKNKEKGKAKRHKEEKRNYQLTDLKIRKSAAIRECHAYIKRRDMGKPCITCSRQLTGKYDSGHFLKAGNHSYTRFMEKNIHSQCVLCNQYNGGREKEYRIALVEKYGERTVKALERVKDRKVKRTPGDYLAIERYYKAL